MPISSNTHEQADPSLYIILCIVSRKSVVQFLLNQLLLSCIGFHYSSTTEMAAMVMSQVASAKLGGLQALPIHSRVSKLGGASVASTPRLMTSLAGRVRCEVGKGEGLLADAKAAVDQQTKTTITKDDILRNQETNESEKKSVFGTEPTSGSLYPRPEVERRPETGSKSFFSVFAFDGAAPETINCRLVIIFHCPRLWPPQLWLFLLLTSAVTSTMAYSWSGCFIWSSPG
jgi:hypothetical protein